MKEEILMFRFFVDTKINNSFVLKPEVLKHIKVARVQNEQFICIFEKRFYVCRLQNNVAEIIEELNEDHEHNGEVIIAASFIDTKRFEWLIQKAAELGCTKLIPVISKNVSKKLPNDISKKIIRWNQIALNASEQSFRNTPLLIEKPMNFEEILTISINNKYIAHEKKSANVDLAFPTNSLFLVGPEGGFTDEEVKLANGKDFKTISLGKRILRAETASIFILSRIN